MNVSDTEIVSDITAGPFWTTLSMLCVSVYVETYGCQMNVSDTEIVWSILLNHGFTRAADMHDVSHSTFNISSSLDS